MCDQCVCTCMPVCGGMQVCVCVQMCEHMCVYIYVMCVHVWEDWQGLSSEAEKKEKHSRKASAGVSGGDAGSGLCSPQSSSPGMDERGKEETEEAAGRRNREKEGLGRAETQRSWACSTHPRPQERVQEQAEQSL